MLEDLDPVFDFDIIFMLGNTYISRFFSTGVRFNLKPGAGSDAVNKQPQYAYAVCILRSDRNLEGVGLAFTLGKGTELVSQAINYLGEVVQGQGIEAMMADFGSFYHTMANLPNLRWLGPHKGVIHLALAAVTNACFDLWAKSRGLPLWKLLLSLSPEELVQTIDFSYLEDVLSKEKALELLQNNMSGRLAREAILQTGYRGYDTSVGWFNYTDEQLAEKVKVTLEKGFQALKLKVGSEDIARDVRRAHLMREIAGDDVTIMLDANQQWGLDQAIAACETLKDMHPYWIEEPTHPDDLYAHIKLAQRIAPVRLALGEHVPNAVMFKNYLQSGIMGFNQVDVVRVGGVSEFLAVSLMSKMYGVPVVPHVGDMGQIHQHLVLFNHIALGHEALFLEHIPHLKEYFRFPVVIEQGYYRVPQEPGMSSDLKSYEG